MMCLVYCKLLCFDCWCGFIFVGSMRGQDMEARQPQAPKVAKVQCMLAEFCPLMLVSVASNRAISLECLKCDCTCKVSNAEVEWKWQKALLNVHAQRRGTLHPVIFKNGENQRYGVHLIWYWAFYMFSSQLGNRCFLIDYNKILQ